MADTIVRNDEVVGSIPTSSTIIFMQYSCHVIGPQEMYDFLTALDDIFKPQQNIRSGGNDQVIDPMGQ